MRVLVVTSSVPFVRGGAEILAENLRDVLAATGHAAELTAIPFKSYPADGIPGQILACRLLDLTESCGTRIDRIIGLKFPAYLIPHPNKVLWLLHQYRTAYELWDHPAAGDLIRAPSGPMIRDAIQRVDRELIPEAKAVYTLSHNVSRRLQRFCGIDSQPLYNPPAHAEQFHGGPAGDYFFFPSRVTRVKRQLLVLEAMAKCRERTIVRFAGEADAHTELVLCQEAIRRLRLENRVEWLGWISEEQKRDLYANCLGVIFPPVDEDYGYITLEGMLSSKPVITCSDSGGTLEFVMDRQTGLVAQPTPESLAQAMDNLWADRRCAAAMGEAGRARYQDLDITWERVVKRLLS
ncbi:MAG TPA: glycosyltransferase family 4 protein [Bryobacteraceae bacterium]|nr:glycosyltransferase family 4 protein [Bryobacteraceae bacterium]